MKRIDLLKGYLCDKRTFSEVCEFMDATSDAEKNSVKSSLNYLRKRGEIDFVPGMYMRVIDE